MHTSLNDHVLELQVLKSKTNDNAKKYDHVVLTSVYNRYMRASNCFVA